MRFSFSVCPSIVYDVGCAGVACCATFSAVAGVGVIGVIGAISLAVSEIFLAFFERILKEFREVKEKIDSCEMSIRTDIWHAREELGKDILNIPEKTVKTEMEFFGTVYDTLEDASKNKNKE